MALVSRLNVAARPTAAAHAATPRRTLAPPGTTRDPRRRVRTAAQKQQFKSFDDMLSRSDVPLLVDFYATWCGPCQMMSPTLAAVASKLKGKVQVVKIDTDKYPSVASQHKVQALPTIALFVKGQMVFKFEGALSEGQLLDKVNYYLSGANARAGTH